MIVMERSDVIVFGDLVDMVPISLSDSIVPLPFIQLFLTVVDAISMLQVILPSSIIICHPVVVEVDASALHHSVIDQPIEDLPIREDVDPLAMENIILPRTEVDIPTLIRINPLTLSQLSGCVELTNVDTAIWVGYFHDIADGFQALEEL